jgi:hypothetical protein
MEHDYNTSVAQDSSQARVVVKVDGHHYHVAVAGLLGRYGGSKPKKRSKFTQFVCILGTMIFGAQTRRRTILLRVGVVFPEDAPTKRLRYPQEWVDSAPSVAPKAFTRRMGIAVAYKDCSKALVLVAGRWRRHGQIAFLCVVVNNFTIGVMSISPIPTGVVS